MRPLKFRYRLEFSTTGDKTDPGYHTYIETYYLTLDELQGDWTSPIEKEQGVPIRSILSRDDFTGLLDKNGVEIYEGDILRSESNVIRLQTGESTGKKSIEYYEVIWHEMMWTTKRIRDGRICRLAINPSIWKAYYEIIGNIWENPELVEEANVLPR